MGSILLVLAAICFFVAMIGRDIWGLNLVAAGLLFWLVAGWVGGGTWPWKRAE